MSGFLNLITLTLGALTIGTGLLSIRADSPVGWVTVPLGVGFMAWALVQEGRS